jgi:hypothetical protein
MRLAVTAVVAALLPALAVGHLEFFCASSVFSNHSQFCNKAIVWLGTCECGSTLTCNDAPTARPSTSLVGGAVAWPPRVSRRLASLHLAAAPPLCWPIAALATSSIVRLVERVYSGTRDWRFLRSARLPHTGVAKNIHFQPDAHA